MAVFSFSDNENKGCTSKEQILAKIRSAILEKDEKHFSNINLHDDTWKPFKEGDGDEFTFIERFKENGGIFLYFESIDHFVEAMEQFVEENNWYPILCSNPIISNIFADSEIEFSSDYNADRKKNVSLITCECMIAQTGSIMVSEVSAGSRAAYSFADTLLVIADPSQFVTRMKDAFNLMKERYDNDLPPSFSIISGPSQSTDIGNEAVTGAIGCKQLALFLVDFD